MKQVKLLALALAGLISFAGCSSAPQSSQPDSQPSSSTEQASTPSEQPKQDATVLKIGVSASEGTPEVEASKKFAEYLEEISGGTMRADVLAGGLGGGERDILEGQQLGTMDMSVMAGLLQNYDPALMVIEYEFLFKNDEHVKKVFNGEIGEKINQRIVDKVGIRPLCVFMRTPRLLTTNKPVNTLSDLQGMKVRVPEMPARIALWKALGANPTPMSFTEVFTALQTKTIDGQENPIGLIRSARIHEVVDNLAMTNHIYGFMFLTISETKFQSLTQEQQGWLLEAAQKAAVYNDELVAKDEKEAMDEVTKTMNVTHPDVTEWRDATKDVYKQFTGVEGFEELYLAIVEAGKEFD